MDGSFQRAAEPSDPSGGRQPKHERLVRLGPERFYLHSKPPSGVPIAVQLGRLSPQMPLWGHEMSGARSFRGGLG